MARNVTLATAQWQSIQDRATQTEKTARETADRMATEAKEFVEFMRRASDTEKATLRLEVDKLRRLEGDWLQVVVTMLDHVFALHQAAVRSGRMDVSNQLGVFQGVCRDVARRVGVNIFEAQGGEAFDASRHQLPQPAGDVPIGAAVGMMLAPGIVFQGRLLRPAMVSLMATPAEVSPSRAEVPQAPAQASLTSSGHSAAAESPTTGNLL